MSLLARLRGRLGRLQDESGQAMILAVFTFALLATLAVTLTDVVTGETKTSTRAEYSDGAYQAAEAGVDSYVAKLLDDHLYYQHYVDAAEATRTSGAITVSAGNDWTGGTTWTYASKDAWVTTANGYAYDLEITAPSGAATQFQQSVQIVSTGCRWDAAGGSCLTGLYAAKREIQVFILPSSIASFQMIANASISYGSAATTNGKLYSTGNISHSGTATANIYAEGQATGSTTLQNGATKYDTDSSPNIRSQIAQPIDFSNFSSSIVDIKRASQIGGVYLHQASAPAAWLVVFNANGTFTAAACSKSGGNDVAQAFPVCGTATTYTLPTNGAIYSDETVIVGSTSSSSSVNGRVTVTSNNNIVIGNDISYATSDSVLGLIAAQTMIVAYWAPSSLTWSAATLSQNGQWTDACGAFGYGCNSHSSMIFNGSTATGAGGSMSMFNSRTYNYDTNLLWLDPPWFPSVDANPYKVLLQRELVPS